MRRRSPYDVTLAAVLLVGLSPFAVQAAGPVTVGPVTPGAGTILQDIKPLAPPAPSQNEPGLQIEQEGGATPPQTAAFLVTAIHISGNTSFDTPKLHALVAEAEGKKLTLPELYERAVRISDFYHAHGYPLARAIVPAQTIRDGVVNIQVIEARYGRILVDNHSHVNDALLKATLAPIKSGQIIGQTDLDHALLLLTDIPGAVTSATLERGDLVGTSDLLVQAAPGPAVAGNVTLDNYGNRYTGSARVGGEVGLNGLLHHGDVLDASVLSSGKDMNYGRISYDSVLDGRGTHLGGSYSALHYILGDSLESLEGHGSAQVESLWAKQPLVRARDLNLYAQLQFDRKELRDDIDVSSIHDDRHLYDWVASLSGDMRDAVLSGGLNTWTLGVTWGRVGFDDPTAEQADAATAKTRGPFSQWDASFARLQRLTRQDGLYIALSGQWASVNLDPSQKMVAGGSYTVRSYDVSALTGDIGVQASVELRHDLARSWYGQWQAVAFFDSERVRVNKNVWTVGVNEATLSGAGMGLYWTGPDQLNAKTYIAARLGSSPELVGDSPTTRAWFEISKRF
jgi:hemolysin activation/secretion protein